MNSPAFDALGQAKTAREREAIQIGRCAAVARGHSPAVALTQQEANVFELAAAQIRSGMPAQAAKLQEAGAAYFKAHPEQRLSAVECLHNGWVLGGLPRLRDMLTNHLKGRPSHATTTALPH